MADAKRDSNFVPTLLGVSNVDGTTPVTIYADPVTHRLLVDLTTSAGTVTSVSVVTANGFAGTVANATTTPAITLTTTVTGILQGNGTAISAATAGTDYTALAFKTISVSGQSDVVADSAADTLTLVGSGITITTNASTDTITFTGAASGLTVGTTAIASGTTTRILYDNAGTLGEYTISGSGTVVAMATSPVFTTPTLGVASATTINRITLTTPATGSTLTIIDGKTLTINKTISFTAADDTGVYTLPTGTKTLVATDVATLSSLTSHGTITTGGLGTGAVIGGVTMTLGSDANYDTYYRNSSGVLTRLANGTTGQVMVATTSNAPSWGSVPAPTGIGWSLVSYSTHNSSTSETWRITGLDLVTDKSYKVCVVAYADGGASNSGVGSLALQFSADTSSNYSYIMKRASVDNGSGAVEGLNGAGSPTTSINLDARQTGSAYHTEAEFDLAWVAGGSTFKSGCMLNGQVSSYAAADPTISTAMVGGFFNGTGASVTNVTSLDFVINLSSVNSLNFRVWIYKRLTA